MPADCAWTVGEVEAILESWIRDHMLPSPRSLTWRLIQASLARVLGWPPEEERAKPDNTANDYAALSGPTPSGSHKPQANVPRSARSV